MILFGEAELKQEFSPHRVELKARAIEQANEPKPISSVQIRQTLRHVPNKKESTDGITFQDFKEMPDETFSNLTWCYHEIAATGQWPQSVQHEAIALLQKMPTPSSSWLACLNRSAQTSQSARILCLCGHAACPLPAHWSGERALLAWIDAGRFPAMCQQHGGFDDEGFPLGCTSGLLRWKMVRRDLDSFGGSSPDRKESHLSFFTHTHTLLLQNLHRELAMPHGSEQLSAEFNIIERTTVAQHVALRRPVRALMRSHELCKFLCLQPWPGLESHGRAALLAGCRQSQTEQVYRLVMLLGYSIEPSVQKGQTPCRY